jgi:signal transduction histidine kinase/CheY-like chemotaxis protein
MGNRLMNTPAKFRWALLGIGALIALGLLAGLTAAVMNSQERARQDAIDRLEVRSKVSSQLLNGTIALTITQLGAQAKEHLGGANPTDATLADWETATRSQATYVLLLDENGDVLASRPSGIEPGDRTALKQALDGKPVLSGVSTFKSAKVIEVLVPFDAADGTRRVLVTSTPLKLVGPFFAGTLSESTGSDEGGALLLDRNGRRVAGTGDPASDKGTAAAIARAIKAGRTTGNASGDHYAIQPMGTTGWQVALIAPEKDLIAGLPDFLWARLALAAFALTLILVVILAGRAIAISRRIEEARAAAVKANDAKSRFLSHISHELKQPLAAIMGFSDILIRQPELLEADRTHYTSVIARSGRTLEQLVSELLDISRIESGRVVLNMEATDVRMAIQDAMELNEPLAAVQHVKLTVDDRLGEGPRPVADPMRLRQVLINLLSNAIKYNRDGGIALVAVEATDHSTIRISVTDAGNGISESDMLKLFHPFERLGEQKSGRSTGTGLGLVITKGLVEAMGGNLAVESEVGTGSTFSFELAEADETTPLPLTSGDSGSRRKRSDLTGHVLYVEDDDANIELVQRVIERDRPGLELETAMTGAEGVQAFAARRPDLLLLDLNLPDMSGEQVLRQLRSDPHTADVPVIVMSADATSLSITRLLQTGADAYVTKPLDLDRFLGAVDVLISRQERPVATAAGTTSESSSS